jgi:cellobiose phosphorylase
MTPWSNDPVTDPTGEAIYLQDLETGQLWTPTALPIRGPGTYIARHGFGYSRFQHRIQRHRRRHGPVRAAGRSGQDQPP